MTEKSKILVTGYHFGHVHEDAHVDLRSPGRFRDETIRAGKAFSDFVCHTAPTRSSEKTAD